MSDKEQRALDAINQVFKDTTVTSEETLNSLESIKEELSILISSIQDTVRLIKGGRDGRR